MSNKTMATKSLLSQKVTTDKPLYGKSQMQRCAYSSSRALHNQKVVQRKRTVTAHNTIATPHHNIKLFSVFFKLKKNSLIVPLLLFIVILSAVPLSIALKSYVWERQRTLIGEGSLLYDLFVVEGFRGTAGISVSEVDHQGYSVPTLRIRAYVVKKGDSLFSIAKRFNVSIDTLISTNQMKDASILQIGTVLKVPNMNGIYYRVKKGDSLSSITSRYGVEMNKLVDVNELDSSIIYADQRLFVPGARLSDWERAEALGTLFKYPARGRISSTMGFRIDPFTKKRAFHAGIDISNRVGMPIYASQSGKVIFTGYKGNYGKTVILSHQQGYTTLYGHLDEILVKKGQTVRQGTKIGTLGNTGRSTGPHLHFEIRRYRRVIDPLKALHR
jgi:murein DD-endopeptidase MepM/ murein hydrolase activator NlpD